MSAAPDRRNWAALLCVVAFGGGFLGGIAATSHAFGSGCPAGHVEVWRVPVTLPCEHWNPPTPRVGAAERVR